MQKLTGIRLEAILKTGLILLLLLLAFWVAADQFILNNFRNLETDWGNRELTRIDTLITGEMVAMKNMLANEAQWDAAYDFVKTGNASFIESDMMILDDLNIDLVLYLDRNCQALFGKHRSTGNVPGEKPLPDEMATSIASEHKKWMEVATATGAEGILLIDSRPLMVAFQPILTSKGSGPPAGTLIIGRWLNNAWAMELGAVTKHQANVALEPFPLSGAVDKTVRTALTSHTESTLSGRIRLDDIYGQPTLLMTVLLPRDIYQQGLRSVQYFLLWFLGGLVTCAVPAYIFFNRWLTTRLESEEKIHHLSYHDTLTNLPNRVFLQEFVQKALHHTTRAKEMAALLFIDLDRFTQVNDTYGHCKADHLLCSVSHWLIDNLRNSDMVARIGGDMFVIFLPAMQDRDAVRKVAHKLLGIKHHPFTIDDTDQFLTCSIGIALFPDDGDNFDALLKLADMAMHEAKRSGRNTYRFTSEEMNHRIAEQHYLEAAIGKALQNGEFSLAYQPQYDLQRQELQCVEALLRWKHPVRGNIPPSVFIPIAEKTGLIYDVGIWALKEACEQIKRWERRQVESPRVAVNFSGLEIKSQDFIEKLERILHAANVAPEKIEIELTESVLMDSVEEMQDILTKLRKRGFRIAVDDFGTGYSSLSYLRHFPIHKVKIDKSFTAGVASSSEDIAIIDAILTIANSLGMEVIAEGVETGEQLDVLLSRGCTGMQGYFFAKPMQAGELGDFCPFKTNPALCSLESPDILPVDPQPT